MRGHLDRQLVERDDFVTHDVGQRYFRRRDQVEGLALAFRAAFFHGEQVRFELRQLAGAAQRIGVDHVRRVALGIAVLFRVRVEHVLRQRAVQAGDAALHDGEARAGQLGGDFEVEPEFGADVDVILDFKIEGWRRADLAHFDVAALVDADRHRRVRQVRHRCHEGGQLGLHFRQRRLVGLELVAQASHFGHHGGGVFAFALEHADLLGQRVALALQVFGAGLDRLAFGFEGVEGGHVEHIFAACQAGGDIVNVFAEKLNVYHYWMPVC